MELARPRLTRRGALGLAGTVAAAAILPRATRAAELPSTITLDWAYYNPVSLILKDKGWVEEAFSADGIGIQWVQSLGSNKALEFLNAGSIDFGSTAGAAALLGRINKLPIKTIYVFSKPEWTALVTRPDTGIKAVADLKGKRVAATKGTDPFIFLLRALEENGLTQSDIELVLLQHDQGKQALERGDVDAWAGLDPMMAQTEIEGGNVLFHRKPDNNSYGVLNVREAFVADHPQLVERLLQVYERGRAHALANRGELVATLAKASKLADPIATRQIERTDLSDPRLGDAQRTTITAAGTALQKAGVIAGDVDVVATVDSLFETRFSNALVAG